MIPLQKLFRLMLIIWVMLLASLAFAISRSTTATYLGNTAVFLFSETNDDPVELPVSPRPPETPPASQPAENTSAPKTSEAEWKALSLGKNAGSGSLGTPTIEQLEGGSVAIVFPLNGTVGDVFFYTPQNVNGATVDFIGEWGTRPYVKRNLSGGAVSLVQSAWHRGYLRVSGVAAKGVRKLEARAEYSASKNAVRVVFSSADAQKGN